ncbi:hypothetical protein [Pseudomonas syringae]|uniref:hypothetical protein n=1 Tax=Pseudomonas syringae TaxID=317 RepID=UPI00200AB730|nr:hypothetical protein [Pseudomonas syringae]MCK9709878.1 hypothetical protein [Pseudomonas syringae pv. syringae]
MKQTKKSLLRVLVIGPLFIMAWCGLSFLNTGTVPVASLRVAFWVTVSCVGIGLWVVLSERKSLQSRVVLDVKPNIIEVEHAESFRGAFSSETHFLTSAGAFQKTLSQVATRKSYARNRFMALRESAYVRIWPDTLGITELELGAIEQLLEEEFILVEVEVMANALRQGGRDTAIKA